MITKGELDAMVAKWAAGKSYLVSADQLNKLQTSIYAMQTATVNAVTSLGLATPDVAAALTQLNMVKW